MARLEVDLQGLTRVLKTRATQAQKVFGKAEKDFEKLVRTWTKRGIKSQEEGRKQVKRLFKKVKATVDSTGIVKKLTQADLYHRARGTAQELEKRMEQTGTRVLKFLQIPTQKELDHLQKKVDDLQRKVSILKKEDLTKKTNAGGAKDSA